MSAPPLAVRLSGRSPTISVSERRRGRRAGCRGRRTRRRSRSTAARCSRAPARRARRRARAPAMRSRSPRFTHRVGRERDLLAAADELRAGRRRGRAPRPARRACGRRASRFVTTTSSAATGKSSSSRSSTSSRRRRRSTSSTWRRAPTTTTSPACSTVSGVGVDDPVPRRTRSTNTRSGANERSSSATCGPRASVGEAERPHVPLAVRRACRRRRRSRPPASCCLELAALLLQVDLEQPWREAREEPDDEAGADQVAHRVGHGDVVQQARLLGLRQVEPRDRVARPCR